MKKAKGMMMKIPCPNGNCSQRNCLMLHTRPPVVIGAKSNENRRNSMQDRTERRGANNSMDEEEEIRKAMVESLAIFLTCQYCGREQKTKEDLQLHQAGNCSKMEAIKTHEQVAEKGPKTGKMDRKVNWKVQEETEEWERKRRNEKLVEETREVKEIAELSEIDELNVPQNGSLGNMRPRRNARRFTWKVRENKEEEKLVNEETAKKVKEIRKLNKGDIIFIDKVEETEQEKQKSEQGIESIVKQKKKNVDEPGNGTKLEKKTIEKGEQKRNEKPRNEDKDLDQENDEKIKTKNQSIRREEKLEIAVTKEKCDNHKLQKPNTNSDRDVNREESRNQEDQENQEQKDRNRDESDEDTESDTEDEMEAVMEKLEKKESIINEQTTQMETMRKELRELRLKERQKDQGIKKITEILINKEDHIVKLSKKISELGTRDLLNLNKKVAKREDKITQTDPEKECKEDNLSSYRILEKLPPIERSVKSEIGGGKKLLNVKITRGDHDRCFNCIELEKKNKEEKTKCSKLEKLVKEYQAKLSTVNGITKEEEGEKKKVPDNKCEQTIINTEQGQERSQQSERNKMEEKSEEVAELEDTTTKRQEEKSKRKDGHEEMKEPKGETASQKDRKKEEEEELRERKTEEEIKKIRGSSDRINNKKDYSKLCNQWVWSRKCTYNRCRFTHKN